MRSFPDRTALYLVERLRQFGDVYLGTGGDGKVFKVDASGKGTLLDLAELNVSALAIGKAGEILPQLSRRKGLSNQCKWNGERLFRPERKIYLVAGSFGGPEVGGRNGRKR